MNKIELSLRKGVLVLVKNRLYMVLGVGLIILCLGNACIHVRGAEITLNNSYGKLSHSAIFVAGGSFGVITGKFKIKGYR